MATDPIIPRKWQLTAHNQRNVFIWGRQERSAHTLMKAFLWALYLPAYPDMSVEVRIGDHYKPDVVAMPAQPSIYSETTAPLFWGEAGQVGRDKIYTLAKRYPTTHFAIAKWESNLRPLVELVGDALKDVRREASFDLINFAADSKDHFIDERGNIALDHDDLDWVRL
jgi:hypothetical protein